MRDMVPQSDPPGSHASSPTPKPNPIRLWGERAITGLLMLVLFGASAELFVRVLNPRPALQVIRPGAVEGLTEHEHYLAWSQPGTLARLHPHCEPDVPEVWLLGDSIFFGIWLHPDAAPSGVLQRLLNEANIASCVRNLSQPGYGGVVRRHVFDDAMDAGRVPRVLVVESWENDAGSLTRIDNAWYALTDMETEADGWPSPPLPVPSAFHHAAFRHSRLWWYSTLALQEVSHHAVVRSQTAYRREHFVPMVKRAQAAGATVITFVVPRLGMPFSDSASHTWPPLGHQARLRAVGSELGVDVIAIADRLADEDLVRFRADTCCHVSAAGAEAYAQVMFPEVAEALRAVAPN